MSEAVQTRTPRTLANPLATGLISGLLYSSAIFGFAFLIPVQMTFSRKGRVQGSLAAALSLLVSLVGQLLPFYIGSAGGLGGSELGRNFLIAALPPAVLLAALVLMNARFWTGRLDYARGLAGAALAALALCPGIVTMSRDPEFLSALEKSFDALITPLMAQLGGEAGGAIFDVKALTKASLDVLFSSFSAIILAWLGTSWWLGAKFSKADSSASLENYRVPYLFVWPFLAAWAFVLVVSYFKLGTPISALAWNLALALSLVYAAQGLGIASHLMRRWNLPRSLKICIGATAIILVITPPVGVVCAAILPLLGVTEVWIPYRNPKGVGA